jgi:uncharacterized protein (DUF2461 family)/DNA polymerase III delta prime subunit
MVMSRPQILEVIESRRQVHGPQGFQVRAEAEGEAREFLSEYAGRMSEEQAHHLGSLLNKDFARGVHHLTRFSPAFHGATMNLLVENLDLFNEKTQILWRGTEEEALNLAGDIFADKQVLPGAGRSYPSVLLYLRDPDRFPVWLNATHKGLRAAVGYQGPTRRGGREAYELFAKAAQEFAAEYDITPQELDGVLTDLGKAAAKGVGEPEPFAALPEDAFAFLKDLTANSNHDWMHENTWRYNSSLAKPFRHLMSALADRHISDLDAQLDTEIKNGHVMASIRKRFADESGEYWPYLWGAFSRGRKQEDAQLFVGVHPDKVRFGFGLGTSPALEKVRNLQSAVKAHGRLLLEALEPVRNRVHFEVGDDDRPFEVENESDLLRWADEEDPRIVQSVSAAEELATSPELVDRVGEVLRAVHPFARAAWGDELTEEVVAGSEQEEESQEPYTLQQLRDDTFLPIELLEEWIELLQGQKRQALFYGAPGTGKTWVAKKLAKHLAGPKGESKVVQFHPSFTYEDFLEGLRPESEGDGLTYRVRPGVFHSFCEQARGKEAAHVFVIDEINRADLGSVLGELMMLLEYRKDKAPLPYSQQPFSVPGNVVVIATMNTADRSLALVDYALRRRFHAIEMRPSREVLQGYLKKAGEPEDSVALRFFDLIQEKVADKDYAPGHSYWMVDDLSLENLQRVWKYELRPYLAEFWFENVSRLAEVDEAVNNLLAEEA